MTFAWGHGHYVVVTAAAIGVVRSSIEQLEGSDVT